MATAKKTAKSVKERVKAKAAKTKANTRAKLKKAVAVALVASCAILCGCATSEPASRLTSAEYGDIVIRLSQCQSLTVNLTIGDGALSSADSAGSTETTTATPTNTTDIKPDIDTTVGGASSGKGLLESAANAIGSLCKSTDGTTATAVTDTSSNCTDGNCSDCSDGSCSYNP